MLKIGLTGNIGSGKSIAASIFEILGIPVYHADEKAKNILNKQDVIEKIKILFGAGILDKTGKPDRKKIAGIVFNNNEKLTSLNKIIHPAVIADFEEWVKQESSFHYIIMESAILFETGYSEMFDSIIVIAAPENIRIERVIKRDQSSDEDVKKRIQNQMLEEMKIKKADFVINNDGSHLMIPQVLKLHQKFLSK